MLKMREYVSKQKPKKKKKLRKEELKKLQIGKASEDLLIKLEKFDSFSFFRCCSFHPINSNGKSFGGNVEAIFMCMFVLFIDDIQ